MTTATRPGRTPEPLPVGASRPYTRAVDAADPDAERTARCSVALSRAFGILGKRWNGVILGALGQGPAGFAELSRAIGSISDSMLSDRLSELVAVGVVTREVAAGPPVTVSYALTAAGEALDPILGDLEGWVRNYLPAPEAADVPERAGAGR